MFLASAKSGITRLQQVSRPQGLGRSGASDSLMCSHEPGCFLFIRLSTLLLSWMSASRLIDVVGNHWVENCQWRFPICVSSLTGHSSIESVSHIRNIYCMLTMCQALCCVQLCFEDKIKQTLSHPRGGY